MGLIEIPPKFIILLLYLFLNITIGDCFKIARVIN